MSEKEVDNECYLSKMIQKWLPGLGVRLRAQTPDIKSP